MHAVVRRIVLDFFYDKKMFHKRFPQQFAHTIEVAVIALVAAAVRLYMLIFQVADIILDSQLYRRVEDRRKGNC